MNLDSNTLHDRKIAILTADGFDESQLFSSKKALEEAGAHVMIVSLKKGPIKSWQQEQGIGIEVDAAVSECTQEIFDGLFIPGGKNYPAELHNENVSEFVKEFANNGKSIATICDGTVILIESGAIKKKTLTTWPTLKSQVLKSGAKWRDDEVVTDNGIVTSRCPNENAVFIKKMIETFSIGPKRSLRLNF